MSKMLIWLENTLKKKKKKKKNQNGRGRVGAGSRKGKRETLLFSNLFSEG
jgi:hypothetical protein